MEQSRETYEAPRIFVDDALMHDAVCLERVTMLADSNGETYSKKRGYADDNERDDEEKETLW